MNAQLHEWDGETVYPLSVLIRDDDPFAVIEYKGRRLIAELTPGPNRMREALGIAQGWKGE